MSENKSRYVLLCQQLLALGTVAALATPGTGVVSLDIVGPSTLPEGEPAASTAPLDASEPVRPEATVSRRGLSDGRWSDWAPVEYHDDHGRAPGGRDV
jgi:hypothetical protein